MQHGSYGRSMTGSRGQQGSLEQLPDGRWRVRYREAGRGGRRPQMTFPANAKREAARWLRDGLAEAEQVLDGNSSARVRRRERARTVDEACDDYLAAHEAAESTLTTIAWNLAVLRKAFGPRPLQSLEPFELQAWRK